MRVALLNREMKFTAAGSADICDFRPPFGLRRTIGSGQIIGSLRSENSQDFFGSPVISQFLTLTLKPRNAALDCG